MTEQNYSIERDLKELQAMAAALIPYIYEDELYGRVGMNLPSLTVGAVLMRLNRLKALANQLSPDQRTILDQAEAQVEDVKKEWGSHFEKKLVREAEARLRDIMTFTREAKESLRTIANAYLPEALRRTMVQEILDVLPNNSELVSKTRQTDSVLKNYLEDADFIWAAALKPIYPADKYWWLYKQPRKPDSKADAR
jgi:DNA-directed RNA polymerase beta' subunit